MTRKSSSTKTPPDNCRIGTHSSFFSAFANKISHWCGSPVVFAMALGLIIVWGVSGPVFGFSDTWQLVINTSTTIITFLMVFIIQHTQNRDTLAVHLKLDELIRATEGAHNALLNLEKLDPTELEKICSHYTELADKARVALRAGKKDTNKPEVKVDFGIE